MLAAILVEEIIIAIALVAIMIFLAYILAELKKKKP
jgi:hypothetical protein